MWLRLSTKTIACRPGASEENANAEGREDLLDDR